MKYSIDEKTLNELFYSARVAREVYTDAPSYVNNSFELNDDEPVSNFDVLCYPDLPTMRIRIELATDEGRFFPFGYCSGEYETIEEAKAAEDYTVVNWEDVDRGEGYAPVYYAFINAPSMTLVVDGETNGNSLPIYIEGFGMPPEFEGWTMEELINMVLDCMPRREVEELEITENGTYGDDVEVGAPVYNRVIVNVPSSGGGDIPSGEEVKW